MNRDAIGQDALKLLRKFVEDWRDVIEDKELPPLPAADCADYVLEFWEQANTLLTKNSPPASLLEKGAESSSAPGADFAGEPADCSACDGNGWLLLYNTDSAVLEVQRCDACARFASDEAALKWLASDTATCIELLGAFCTTLAAEAERAATEHDVAGWERVMQTIRGSLLVTLSLCDRATRAPAAEEDPHEVDSAAQEETTRKRTYTVGVREVHVRHYEVDAANPEDAKSLVHQRAPGVMDIEFEEFSHELGQDTWSVEESTAEDAP